MYYLLAAAVILIIFRYFNLIPQLSNKFWQFVDYVFVFIGFVLLLSRIPPFFSGILLTLVLVIAWQKGFFNKFR
jgi:hypothetical protein